MDTDITYINRFLQDFSRDEYHMLLGRHPDDITLKAKGVVLGDTDTTVALDAAKTMLENVDIVITEAITDTLKKLKASRKLELVGTIFALFTSGGVVGNYLQQGEHMTTAVLGAFGFLNAIALLIAKWLRGSVAGSGDLSQDFIKLHEYSWDSRMLKAKLKPEISNDVLEEVISKSNSLAREINMLLATLGYIPNFEPI